jgi:hypothetical protein
MRTVGTVTAESKPERAWPQSTHIVWPSKGGGLKLRDQNNLMQAVLKESMEGALCNLIFDDSYPTIESRPKFCQTLIRKAAKKIGTGATPIGKRAKHDLDFCASLASLVCLRAPFVYFT